MKNNSDISFVFFGTSEFAVGVLETLKSKGYIPSLIVTTEDKPQGRGMQIQSPPTKIWAEIHKVNVFQPSSLKSPEVEEKLRAEKSDVFIVAAYGKLIPTNIFELPAHKTLNVHPSLLPRLRGASPIESSILTEDGTGVTIMQINEGMDEGPVISQTDANFPDWPPKFKIVEELLARLGGEMLADILPQWIEGKIEATEQDNSLATYCKKISKSDGEINLNDSAELNLRKVCAFSEWPGAYTYFEKKNGEKIRLVIKEAEIVDGKFCPLIVVPAGKKEMNWSDFLRGNA